MSIIFKLRPISFRGVDRVDEAVKAAGVDISDEKLETIIRDKFNRMTSLEKRGFLTNMMVREYVEERIGFNGEKKLDDYHPGFEKEVVAAYRQHLERKKVTGYFD